MGCATTSFFYRTSASVGKREALYLPFSLVVCSLVYQEMFRRRQAGHPPSPGVRWGQRLVKLSKIFTDLFLLFSSLRRSTSTTLDSRASRCDIGFRCLCCSSSCSSCNCDLGLRRRLSVFSSRHHERQNKERKKTDEQFLSIERGYWLRNHATCRAICMLLPKLASLRTTTTTSA